MTNTHPLLARATSYLRPDIDLSPKGCDYDPIIGAWRDKVTGVLWAELPHREGPRTKKHDIETGEDQKGE